MYHHWAKRPPEIKTSVSYLRSRHWQHELIQSHEHLDLIRLFQLPSSPTASTSDESASDSETEWPTFPSESTS